MQTETNGAAPTETPAAPPDGGLMAPDDYLLEQASRQAESIASDVGKRIRERYMADQREHGGNLADRDPAALVDEAREELIDALAYLFHAKHNVIALARRCDVQEGNLKENDEAFASMLHDVQEAVSAKRRARADADQLRADAAAMRKQRDDALAALDEERQKSDALAKSSAHFQSMHADVLCKVARQEREIADLRKGGRVTKRAPRRKTAPKQA